MNNSGHNEDIKSLRRIKWRTSLSKHIDEFSNVIKDDNTFEKYFGEKYVDKLSSKSKEISRNIVKLGIVYTALMLALFASQSSKEVELQVFGYGFKNLGYYKEFFLLLASTISPITAVLGAYKNYLDSLTNECLKKLAPDSDTRRFFAHKFVDEYFDVLTYKNTSPSTLRHGFARLVAITFGLTMVFLALTLIVASFFIQINVIYDVVTNPSSPKYINYFVVTFVAASILFSWLVTILQFPMPEVDLSNNVRLMEIKKENPERYVEIMRKVARENAKKEMLSRLIQAPLIYIVTFVSITIYYSPSSMENVSAFLEIAMKGVFVVTLFSVTVITFASRKLWSWFFRKYPDESKERMRIFPVFNRALLVFRLTVPFLASLAYASYALA